MAYRAVLVRLFGIQAGDNQTYCQQKTGFEPLVYGLKERKCT